MEPFISEAKRSRNRLYSGGSHNQGSVVAIIMSLHSPRRTKVFISPYDPVGIDCGVVGVVGLWAGRYYQIGLLYRAYRRQYGVDTTIAMIPNDRFGSSSGKHQVKVNIDAVFGRNALGHCISDQYTMVILSLDIVDTREEEIWAVIWIVEDGFNLCREDRGAICWEPPLAEQRARTWRTASAVFSSWR
jgi:hypothetical protein